MNILWITNTIFPAPSEALGIAKPVIGGWMYGLAERVAASPGVRFAVATTYLGREIKRFDIDGVRYYLLPAKPSTFYQKHLEPLWQNIAGEFEPDIVHVHGTESLRGLAFMRACPKLNYVVSIQGMASGVSKYYFADMRKKDIMMHITFRDIIRRDTILEKKIQLEKMAVFEREFLQRTRHIIGRTRWDYAHAKRINPEATYHTCNESLRDGFYSAEKWDAGQKKKGVIFLSQVHYPIKGAHQVFKAVSLLKNEFPDIRVRIAGNDITRNSNMSEKIRLSGYGNYLRTVIKREGIRDYVQFLGPLNELQMIYEYRNAHVFICPSSIENSPNSLGEAQILGTPSIASYVGGVPDMVTDGNSGLLYRFEEFEMLTEHIRRLFTDDQLAMRLSTGGIRVAEGRHDRKVNFEKTVQIYQEINNES